MKPVIVKTGLTAGIGIAACIAAFSYSSENGNVTALRKRDTEKLVTLSKESRALKPICKAFSAEVAALDAKELDSENILDERSLATRAELDTLTRLISRYPGTPAATQKMLRDFLNFTLSYGDKISVQEGLSTGIADTYPCEVLGYWSAVKIALNTANRLKLSASEKQKIGHDILGKIQHELSSPLSLINLAIQSEISERLVREKFLTMSDASYFAILDLLDESVEFRTELRKTFGKYHDHPKQILKELRGATRFGTRLSRILSRI